MATTEQKARARAAELNIELGIEPDEDGWMIEVWSYDAHLRNDDPSHTYFVHHTDWASKTRTPAQKWREVLLYMNEELQPCPADCECWQVQSGRTDLTPWYIAW